jgi:drug/metabolite transporter (DMT)-like permease
MKVSNQKKPTDPSLLLFYFVLLLAVFAGGMNQISQFMSSVKHSPLTTTIAGNTKDVVQTLIGGYFFRDYNFHILNGIGIFLSFLGCAGYVREKMM